MAASGLSVESLGRQGWNVLSGDLPMPCAVLKESALRDNSAMMARFLELTGARLCPHGKTTMSPELMRRQIADGAWGITAANARQMAVMHAAGIRRVLIANQVVGQGELDILSQILVRDPEFEVFMLVDSVDLVTHLEEHLRLPSGRRPAVLLEVGQMGGRTGARTPEQALETARAVSRSAKLKLRGVECYEGILPGASDAEIEAKVASLYRVFTETARACEAEGLFAEGPIILSGGGSAYYDLAAEGIAQAQLKGETWMVIRSGCYLTHDAVWLANYHCRMVERSPELTRELPKPRAALEVWAAIQSTPEPGLAIATLGKRDISYDMDLPVPLAWFRPGMPRPEPLDGHSVTGMNDQHAYVALPEGSPLRVGDMVAFGISHPCTTFDKWRLIAVIDDDYNVIDAISTAF